MINLNTRFWKTLVGSLVLVTGATGFTGRAVLHRLAGEGARVRAVIREKSDISGLEELGIEWVKGDLTDKAFAHDVMADTEYAIHMASSYRDASVPPSEEYRLHVEGTRHLAEAAIRQPDFKRFVHVSSIGVHGHIEDPPANEEYRFAPGDTYQETKLAGEQWIRSYSRESHLPVVVVRPAAIYGPGDTRLLKLFKMATLPVVPLVGNGKCLYHLIHVEDLAAFLLHTATHPRAAGEVFICGNDSPINLETIITTAAECFGVESRFVRVPEQPVKMAAVLCEKMCQPLGVRPPLHSRRVAFFTKDRAFDTSKMRTMLDFTPKHGNLEGIRETARWYAEKGWVRSKGMQTS